MQIVDAKTEPATAVAQAVSSVVRAGGLAIFPTDTVYGIGCDPASERAVDRIYAAKGRSREKPLSLHFATVEELLEYAQGNELAKRAAWRFLPGPLTLIVARPAWVGAFVTGGRPTLGLRAPNHALCGAILEASGPLAATSANYSGASAFAGGGAVTGLPAADVFVDDGPTPLGAESTVIDVSGERPRMVREGAIKAAMLEDELGPFETRDGR
jgi:L-threonylcarbamoyladenylate synthase